MLSNRVTPCCHVRSWSKIHGKQTYRQNGIGKPHVRGFRGYRCLKCRDYFEQLIEV